MPVAYDKYDTVGKAICGLLSGLGNSINCPRAMGSGWRLCRRRRLKNHYWELLVFEKAQIGSWFSFLIKEAPGRLNAEGVICLLFEL